MCLIDGVVDYFSSWGDVKISPLKNKTWEQEVGWLSDSPM